jgi:hypothetical protein
MGITCPVTCEAPSGSCNRILCAGKIDISDNDFRALSREGERCCPSDARRASRDYHDLAGHEIQLPTEVFWPFKRKLRIQAN